MRILAIRGQNLASLAEPFAIDLTAEPLAGTGLFAITGETGAGKSTILDALCLALYGDYPRVAIDKREKVVDPSDAQVQVSDPRNILRRGAGGGYAEVDFVGNDGIAYRARWAARRAFNTATGRLQNVERTLERRDGTAVIATGVEPVLAAVIARSGFTFEEFRRSVLLAQGEFDAFLLADETQRAALLEKITGTAVYSRISMQVFKETGEREGALKARQEKRAAIGLKSEADIAALTAEQDQVRQERDAASADLARVQEVLKRMDDVGAAQAAVERADAEVVTAHAAVAAADAALKTAQAEKEERAAEATKVEAEVAALEPVWQQAFAHDAKIGAAEEERAAAEAALEKAKVDAKSAETSLADLRDANGKAEAQHAAALAALDRTRGHAVLAEARSRIGPLCDAYASLVRRLDEDRKKSAAAEAEIDRLNRAVEAADTGIANNRDERSKLATSMAERKAALEAMDRTALNEREETLLALAADLERAGAAVIRRDTAREAIRKARADAQTAAADEAAGARHLDEARQNHETASAKRAEASHMADLAEATLSAHAAHLRSVLADGAPCPVCGASEHPYAGGDDAAAAMAHAIRARRDALDRALADAGRTLTDAERGLVQATARREAALRSEATETRVLDEAIAALRALLPAATARVRTLRLARGLDGDPEIIAAAHIGGLRAECAALRQTIASARSKVKTLEPEIAGLDRRDRDLADAIDEAAESRDADRGQIARKEAELAGLVARSKELAVQIEAKRSELAPLLTAAGLSAADLDRDAGAARRRLDQLAAAYLGLVEQRQAMESDIATLATKLQIAGGNLTNAKAEHARCNEGVRQRTERVTALRAERAGLLGGLETKPHRDAAIARQTAARAALKVAEDHVAALGRDLAGRMSTHTASVKADEMATATLAEARTALATAAAEAGGDATAVQALLAGGDDVRAAVTAQRDVLMGSIDSSKARLVLVADELKRDGEARQMDAEIAAEIVAKTRDLEVWQAVNAAIGQADGAKFRRFAQSVTLAHLVALANSQLDLLNPRYRLRRSPLSDLALDVVDRDMGDEIRSPRSLSGGERFLVSLALALALSGLEGRQSFVDTLFIDEGFGSLDRETLDVAVTALETLQGQGRKVGVITHVPAMIEQIAVQVRVEKRGNGRSAVRVVEGGAAAA